MDCCRCHMPIHRDDPRDHLGDRVAHRHARCVDLLRMRIAELERMVVWAVQHAAELELAGEKVSIYHYEDPSFASLDPAKILAAVKEAMGDA